MSETARQTNPNELSEIYAKLNQQDVEQFYAGYQWWNLQQRSVVLQEQMEDLRREIAANAELMEMVHPTAIALATMARLQASGVKDLDLLDRMLERGEDWLDRTMQRLDYCEQLDFILDDYTQWCQNALEGAYDWIDSMRESGTASSTEVPASDTSPQTTEEIFLQKLASEEEVQSSPPETTFELSPSPLQELASALEEPPTIIPEEEGSTPEEHTALIEEAPVNVETLSSPEEAMPESQEDQLSQPSQVSQPVEVNLGPDSHVTAVPASDISTEQAVQEEPSTTKPSIEPGPTSDSEQSDRQEHSELSIGEGSESEQFISQVYIEFDPAPEELPSVEGNDGSDFKQSPLQEHSKDILADESPIYWEEPLPYRVYPPDKQPDIEAGGLEDAEQDLQVVTPERRRNFVQRLAAKFWRS